MRLDLAYALESAPDRISVGSVNPSHAEIILGGSGTGSQDTRSSTDLGKSLIAQAADRQSPLRRSVSGAPIVRAAWRPAWRVEPGTAGDPAAPPNPTSGFHQRAPTVGPLEVEGSLHSSYSMKPGDTNPSGTPRVATGRNTPLRPSAPSPQRLSRSPSPHTAGPQGEAGHGLARIESKDGRVCEGSWAKINGKLIGVGIISFPGGTTYQGEWLEYEPHGYGIQTTELGAVFEGEFNLGEKHGYGSLTEPDGKRQVGCWSKGKREGWTLAYAAHGAPLTLREHKNDVFVGRQVFSAVHRCRLVARNRAADQLADQGFDQVGGCRALATS